MAVDRRVARTRSALYEALVALVGEKPYELISVEDLLARAGVARSTFYAHFRCKDHLLAASLERLEAELVAGTEAAAAPAGWSRSRILFEHVGRHADLQLSLARGRGGAIVRDAIGQILARLLRTWLPVGHDGRVPREVAIRFLVATIDMLISWWLAQRRRPQAAEVDAIFRKLVSAGLPPEAHLPITAGGASRLGEAAAGAGD